MYPTGENPGLPTWSYSVTYCCIPVLCENRKIFFFILPFKIKLSIIFGGYSVVCKNMVNVYAKFLKKKFQWISKYCEHFILYETNRLDPLKSRLKKSTYVTLMFIDFHGMHNIWRLLHMSITGCPFFSIMLLSVEYLKQKNT